MSLDIPLWQSFHDRLKFLLEEMVRSDCGVVKIVSRVKSLESIQEKLRRKKFNDPNNLLDIVGFRIVVENDSDIGRVYNCIASELSLFNAMLYSSSDSSAEISILALTVHRWNFHIIVYILASVLEEKGLNWRSGRNIKNLLLKYKF